MPRITLKILVNLAVLFLIVICSYNTCWAGSVVSGVYGTWGNATKPMFQVAKENNFKIAVSTDYTTAASLNMQCLYPFWLTKEIAENDSQWKAFIANVKAVVSSNKNNPAIFGWYLTDEPESHGVPLSKIKELSQIVKAIDKSKPTFVVLGVSSQSYKYIPYFDIIGIDPYIETVVPANSSPTDKIADWIKRTKRDLAKLKLKKPVYVVLGAFDSKPKGTYRYPFRKPTPTEFKQMVSICLQQKVDGILVFSLTIMEDSRFYAWDLTTDDPALWSAVKSLPNDVKQ